MIFGIFHSRDGNPLDQVLCTVFRAPASYLMRRLRGDFLPRKSPPGHKILENLLLEARLARREFTLRALLNGKLDLTQAEAVNDLITATGSKAESSALMQVRGLLSQPLKELLKP